MKIIFLFIYLFYSTGKGHQKENVPFLNKHSEELRIAVKQELN